MKSEQTNDQISLLHDGQLEASELARLAQAACADRDLRRRLHRYSLIGDCIRGAPIHVCEQFSQQLMARIESEPEQDASETEQGDATVVGSADRGWSNPVLGFRYRWGLAAAALFVVGIAVGSLLVPQSGDFRAHPSVAGQEASEAQTLVVASLSRLPAELEPLVAAHGEVTFGKHAGTGFLPYAPQLVIERDSASRVGQ